MSNPALRAEAQMEEHALELERLAIAGFIEILGREQRALTAHDLDAVDALAPEKARQLDQLTKFSEQRGGRLRAAGCSPDAQGMRAWLEAHAGCPGVRSAWERLAETAERARDQNEVNGWVVALQMQRTQRQLAFLNRMASNEPTYSADGVARSALRQRSLGEA